MTNPSEVGLLVRRLGTKRPKRSWPWSGKHVRGNLPAAKMPAGSFLWIGHLLPGSFIALVDIAVQSRLPPFSS